MSAPVANGAAPPATPKSPEEEEKLATDDSSKDIHQKLKDLRLDEVVGLSQSSHNLRTINTVDNWTNLILTDTGRYLRYLFQTWSNVLWSATLGGVSLFDLASILFFAIGGTILLFVVLLFCIAIHFPALVRLYYHWSDKYGGGLGLVNSGNPNLFHALTLKQAEAAKAALSAPIKESQDNDYQRFFNLDIAKFLLQIASVIYEHENDAVRAAVTIAAQQGPLSFVPAAGAATAELITKLSPIVHAPGALLGDLFSGDASDKAAAALDSKGDRAIRDFCKRFNIEYEPASEMGDVSSAFCGLFWDPKSTWIVVAFKGTAPIEFAEWLSDFNAAFTSVGTYIPGFNRVHKGFKERVFPEDVSDLGNFRPYDTVSLAVKTLSKHLAKSQPTGTKINVWFTGHSLGCATASLVYSRFLMEHKDMGKKSMLRDAYLFAAPIVCDSKSVDAFNAAMAKDKKRPKTMWRVTSNGDAVATCLPELGDNRNINISDNNAFAFAHLGTEIKMRDHPHSSNVTGNHVTRGSKVAITSAFSVDEIAQQRKEHLAQPGEQKRETIGVMLQRIPLIGRVVAHCTIYYWDQLDRVALGKCDWIVN